MLGTKNSPRKSTEGLHPFETPENELPAMFVEKAEQVLNETPRSREEGLKKLKELIRSENEDICDNDDDLLLFLRGKKFDVQKAFKHLKRHVAIKRKNAHLIFEPSIERLTKFNKDGTFTLLPFRDTDGCAVVVIRLENCNPSDYTEEELLNNNWFFLYFLIRDVMTQVNGIKIIINSKLSNPFKCYRFLAPRFLMQLNSIVMDAFPIRFKGFHVTNNSFAFKTMWAVAQPFLTEKLKKRIHIHQKKEHVVNHFPASIVPVDFGGQLAPLDNEAWFHKAAKSYSPSSLDEFTL